MIDAVRHQHVTRAIEFLVSELGISESEARGRIFFVSGKEILENKTNASTHILAEWNRSIVKYLILLCFDIVVVM